MNDGGKAFPRPGFTAEQTESQEGMSLRDWFAGQAIAGFCGNSFLSEAFGRNADFKADDEVSESRAIWAYKQADAMLAERSKCPSS